MEKTVNTADSCEEQEYESLGSKIAVSSNFTCGFSEQLWREDVETRKLFLTDYVDSDIYDKINYFIIRCNEMDKENNVKIKDRVPIRIFINSGGGSVWDGLSCIETIRCSKTPVYAICTGYALSMAFHIFVNCHKRFATKSAFFLNHEGEEGFINSLSKLRDYMKFSDKLSDRLDEYVAEKTKLGIDELKSSKRIEQYYFADEAKEVGIVDKIVTSIDEIL